VWSIHSARWFPQREALRAAPENSFKSAMLKVLIYNAAKSLGDKTQSVPG